MMELAKLKKEEEEESLFTNKIKLNGLNYKNMDKDRKISLKLNMKNEILATLSKKFNVDQVLSNCADIKDILSKLK